MNNSKKESQKLMHKIAFQKLCTLVGKWKDVNSSTLVDFRMSANNTVIVETWFWPEENIEALTLYHMDIDKLISTHYCPAGNQPRLVFESNEETLLYKFKYISATNLPDPNIDHNIEFWIKINNINSFTRNETYVEKGILDIDEKIFIRINI